uniref:Uncharacterized protein n=1 Tax=Physcomitrium patens TaxID=3218 RepID=A0A2K1K1W4_PHYPA|nr:hypothetical protein PHYPA_012246 [Physcomitrium patens]
MCVRSPLPRRILLEGAVLEVCATSAPRPRLQGVAGLLFHGNGNSSIEGRLGVKSCRHLPTCIGICLKN